VVWPGMPFPNLDGRIHQSLVFFYNGTKVDTIVTGYPGQSRIRPWMIKACPHAWPIFGVRIFRMED
jgi:hypothetical protein